ncbi:LysM peptidoglycan-binding domain-containing protein [Paenibacillus harenae]|uniref:LysM peptidoglycan-binding domain-containing protein n=1 Tax=Paenibacillus harenae TaxID=306543 RepID=UPI00278E6101|nr:LysM domain-containing protein [Paenibacillus harenae]MDQ0062240.1 hypothetical protein [Paenibacillus harenae]
MDRGFVPGGFGGFRRPFRPFPHPFFPGRFLFPFFFFSPFFFPFFPFREDGTIVDNDMFVAQHQVQAGDSMDKIAHMYNIPKVILDEANPQLAGQGLQPGTQVHIPRISHMGCQKTYIEGAADAPMMANQMHQAGQANQMYQASHPIQPSQMHHANQPNQPNQSNVMPFSGKLY